MEGSCKSTNYDSDYSYIECNVKCTEDREIGRNNRRILRRYVLIEGCVPQPTEMNYGRCCTHEC